MQVRLTHLLWAGGLERPADALAVAIEDGRRYFVPGWLPCGECGSCRRGWVAVCPQGRTPTEGALPDRTIDVPDRFLAAVDDPPGAAELPGPLAACAGVVAELQELSARAGLGGGDLAVWIGEDARCTLGARLSASRGVSTFRVGAPEAAGSKGVTSLPAEAGARTWTDALAAAASGAPGGFQERRIFVADASPALVAAALALAAPGTTLAFLAARGEAQVPPGALSSGRMVVGAGRGYHPDFVPEALATLRRETDLVTGLVLDGSASQRGAAHFTLQTLAI